jgi:hypothetical protein
MKNSKVNKLIRTHDSLYLFSEELKKFMADNPTLTKSEREFLNNFFMTCSTTCKYLVAFIMTCETAEKEGVKVLP